MTILRNSPVWQASPALPLYDFVYYGESTRILSMACEPMKKHFIGKAARFTWALP